MIKDHLAKVFNQEVKLPTLKEISDKYSNQKWDMCEGFKLSSDPDYWTRNKGPNVTFTDPPASC